MWLSVQELSLNARVGMASSMVSSFKNVKKYQEVMDAVREKRDPEERLEVLQAKLAELEKDPTNLQLSRYLRAEQAHLMFSSNTYPNSFKLIDRSA